MGISHVPLFPTELDEQLVRVRIATTAAGDSALALAMPRLP